MAYFWPPPLCVIWWHWHGSPDPPMWRDILIFTKESFLLAFCEEKCNLPFQKGGIKCHLTLWSGPFLCGFWWHCLCQYFCGKKIQCQNVTGEKLPPKKLCIKCWWNWLLVFFSAIQFQFVISWLSERFSFLFRFDHEQHNGYFGLFLTTLLSLSYL